METPPQLVKSLRITIPLSKSDPSQNIFSYSKLKQLHIQALLAAADPGISKPAIASSQVLLSKADGPVDLASTPQAESQSDSSDSENPDAPKVAKSKPKSKKIDLEQEYDYQDDFIDDSDMFLDETSARGVEPPPIADFGFFVYAGPIDVLFTNSYIHIDIEARPNSKRSRAMLSRQPPRCSGRKTLHQLHPIYRSPILLPVKKTRCKSQSWQQKISLFHSSKPCRHPLARPQPASGQLLPPLPRRVKLPRTRL